MFWSYSGNSIIDIVYKDVCNFLKVSLSSYKMFFTKTQRIKCVHKRFKDNEGDDGYGGWGVGVSVVVYVRGLGVVFWYW